MFSSVQVGLREALELEPQGLLVLPVDHPSVKRPTIAALAEMLGQAIAACAPKERARFSYAIVPRHRGRRGHPLALTPALAASIAKDREAADLGDAVRRHARLVGYLDVADAGILRNVNRPGD